MITPPPTISTDNMGLLADWVELAVLCSFPEPVSHADTYVLMDQAQLLPTDSKEDLGGEESYDTDDATDSDDQKQVVVDRLWQELRDSAKNGERRILKFDKNSDTCSSLSNWRGAPARTSSLLWSLKEYWSLKSVEADSTLGNPLSWDAFANHFEDIVLASARASCGKGIAATLSASNPPGIHERIENLATEVGLTVNPDVLADVRPTEKDLGLDVLVRVSHGNDGGGALYCLIDATVGDYRNKYGKPKMDRWEQLLNWDSPPGMIVGAIAFPTNLGDYKKTNLKFISRNLGRLVFDRSRVFVHNPDLHLLPAEAARLVDWCQPRIDHLLMEAK